MIVEKIKMQQTLNSIKQKNKKLYGNSYNKNILFLDFDGVINIPVKFSDDLSDEDLINLYKFANKKCMDNLNKLCKMFDFKIVISSSWRISGMDYCKKYLLDSGLDESIEIIGMTKNEEIVKRYYEIYDYLIKFNNFTNFLILDDIYMESLSSYAILTQFEKGFDEEMLKKAIELFNKNNK